MAEDTKMVTKTPQDPYLVLCARHTFVHPCKGLPASFCTSACEAEADIDWGVQANEGSLTWQVGVLIAQLTLIREGSTAGGHAEMTRA